MPESSTAQFDAYAAQYEQTLNKGLSVSGETPEYFANRRVQWTQTLLSNQPVKSVFDFGCGVGTAAPVLASHFQPDELYGFDPSNEAIKRARLVHDRSSHVFTADAAEVPENQFDLAYCNGVFHHIMPEDRDAAFSIVHRSLKPRGWFAFWENNPWNPGTRYVMSRVEFDKDAVTISPREATQLLSKAGFEVNCLHSWFLFPRMLSWLRPLESLVYRLPLGAQYLVLAQKKTDVETSVTP